LIIHTLYCMSGAVRPDVIGVLASPFAVIAAVAIITFIPLGRGLRVFLAVSTLGGIAALSWATSMLSGQISELTYMIFIGIHVLCGAAIGLLTSSKTICEKMTYEPIERSIFDDIWGG